jgi:hypothetical protein
MDKHTLPAVAEPIASGSLALRHMTQLDLARRWRVSPRTLERWRSLRQGPPYLKLGAIITYRVEDIETYEAAQRRSA